MIFTLIPVIPTVISKQDVVYGGMILRIGHPNQISENHPKIKIVKQLFIGTLSHIFLVDSNSNVEGFFSSDLFRDKGI